MSIYWIMVISYKVSLSPTTIITSHQRRLTSLQACLTIWDSDVATVGNHDIETGHKVYDKWFKELKFPILGANIIDTKTNKPYILPYYTIKKKNGIKVCVIGMLTPAIPNWLKESIWSGLRFEEMVSCAKRTMAEVKTKEKPDIIVGLSILAGMEVSRRQNTTKTLRRK